ncbi:hypothetical protein GCM10009557_37280 [Virgisporangium ochraceum]|uniref:DUF1707 domain-containing protein n=1 Tax=Virgisporangium ochraceum TaxID=65505 RepID=A0A8J4A329_9ACTN|nr:DUF1707 domain-containing protein [Virgisporangium ochraceum]GIJ73908.1 hypothetical protein Voc01_088250 [Virgisporangium ochraceum]
MDDASDAERNAAVAALGDHFEAGGIDAADYERRALAAAAATSRADLVAVFSGVGEGGPGTLAADLRARLVAEGLLFLAENLPGVMVFRRYRTPGQRVFRRTVRVRGAVGVSRRGLVVWAGGAKRVDVPFADPRWDAAMSYSVDRAGRLRIVGAVGPFHPDRSGRIEYRFTTGHAREIVALLRGSR